MQFGDGRNYFSAVHRSSDKVYSPQTLVGSTIVVEGDPEPVTEGFWRYYCGVFITDQIVVVSGDSGTHQEQC